MRIPGSGLLACFVAIALSVASSAPAGDVATGATTLSDLAFIQGHWRGDRNGDLLEEVWSAPSNDCMMGMFRWIKGGTKTWMFEFLTIVQDDAGVAFRFKHFSRELVGWEEKDESLNFRLVRTAEREAVFENPKEDHPRRMIFRSPEPDHLTVRLEGYTDGKLEATEFLYQRVK